MNSFLNDFVKMRKSLKPDVSGVSKVHKAPIDTTVSMATIIESKPPQKAVIEFFRRRIADIELNETKPRGKG